MKKVKFAIVLAALMSLTACAGENSTLGKKEINMLFIGNSFTFRHDLPDRVKQVIEEGQPGLTVNVDRVVYGGQNMFKHSTYYFSQSFIEQSTISDDVIQERIAKMEDFLTLQENPAEWTQYYEAVKPEKRVPAFSGIFKNIRNAIKNHKKLLGSNPRTKWDYVVLQSWVDECPSLDDGYAKYTAKLAEVAKQQGAEVILYITAPYIQNKAPVDGPLLQEKVDMELKMAKALQQKIGARAVVPVPLAINMIQKGGTRLTFCYVHDFHPNQTCAFLTSNMFYAALFGKSTEGFEYNSVTETKQKDGKDPDGGELTVVFDKETKEYLQRMAYEAVMNFNQGNF